jgi:multidrug efflux system outer membrane protein
MSHSTPPARVVALPPALALSALILAGCAAGPDYVEPDLTAPDAWTCAIELEMSSATPDLEAWWTALGDTALVSLIAQADTSNLGAAAALARLEEARAAAGIARGAYWPRVDARGNYTRAKLSEQSSPGNVTGGGPDDLWEAGFDATWEIDVFGRNRRLNEAALASWEASVEGYRDALVTLYAEVASNYVLVRTLQTRLDYATANVKALESTAQLTQDRYDAGLTSLLDVTRAQSNLASTRASIPSLEADLEAALNRMAVLLGQAPGSLHGRMAASTPLPQAPDSLLVGLPAELLRRRPDVRRAERQLAAQTARIGVASADLYPTFSISGFLGLEATDFGDLTGDGGATWGLIPGFRWNLFNGGATRSRIQVEEARAEQALAAYEETVLRALEDVENAMVGLDRARKRRDELLTATEATASSVDLVHTQYISGLTDFQNYLDAQRSLVGQQDQLAISEGAVVQQLIALNKALGGGWSPDRIPARLLVAEEDDR